MAGWAHRACLVTIKRRGRCWSSESDWRSRVLRTAASSSSEPGLGAAAGGRGAMGRAWSDGAHEQDGAAAALGELGQGGKGLTKVVGAAGVQGVEDDQGGMGAGDGFFQQVQVAGEGEGTLLDGDGGAVDLCDGGEQEPAGGVDASGQE